MTYPQKCITDTDIEFTGTNQLKKMNLFVGVYIVFSKWDEVLWLLLRPRIVLFLSSVSAVFPQRTESDIHLIQFVRINLLEEQARLCCKYVDIKMSPIWSQQKQQAAKSN